MDSPFLQTLCEDIEAARESAPTGQSSGFKSKLKRRWHQPPSVVGRSRFRTLAEVGLPMQRCSRPSPKEKQRQRAKTSITLAIGFYDIQANVYLFSAFTFQLVTAAALAAAGATPPPAGQYAEGWMIVVQAHIVAERETMRGLPQCSPADADLRLGRRFPFRARLPLDHLPTPPGQDGKTDLLEDALFQLGRQNL